MVREFGPGDKRLVAYVTPGSTSPDGARILASLSKLIPHFMIPNACVVIPEIPLKANGKVNRSALPAPMQTKRTVVAPRTDTEAKLKLIWEGLLQSDGFGIEESFASLGGHSLLSMRMLAAVNEAFQRDLPLRQVLENSTIEALGRLIDTTEFEGDTTPTQKIKRVSREQFRPNREAIVSREVIHD